MIKGDAFDTQRIPPGVRRKRGDKRGSGHKAGMPVLTGKGVRVVDSLVPMDTGDVPAWMARVVGVGGWGARAWNRELRAGYGKLLPLRDAAAAPTAEKPEPLVTYPTRGIVAQALVEAPESETGAGDRYTFVYVQAWSSGPKLMLARGSRTGFSKVKQVAQLPHAIAHAGMAIGADGSLLFGHRNGMLTCVK
jgi:hypothetical protein